MMHVAESDLAIQCRPGRANAEIDSHTVLIRSEIPVLW